MKLSHEHVLRLIAVFKFVKAALLIAVAVGALKLLHKDIAESLTHAIEAMGLDPGSHLLNAAIEKASSATPTQVKTISFGGFVYAGLFLAEGTGLWLKKRWGEWLTVIITSSLIPIEIYEIVRHISVAKAGTLMVNVVIVAYLVYHIRTQPQAATR